MTLQSHSWAYIQKKKNLICRDSCTPIFIAALSTIAKTWKQPKCPLTDEQEDEVHAYSGILSH